MEELGVELLSQGLTLIMADRCRTLLMMISSMIRQSLLLCN
jgi:hypothetical protein